MKIKIEYQQPRKVILHNMKENIPHSLHQTCKCKSFNSTTIFVKLCKGYIIAYENNSYPFGKLYKYSDLLIKNLVFAEINATVEITLNYDPNKGENNED